MSRTSLAVAVLAVAVVAGGGGYYAYRLNADPLRKAEALSAKGDLRQAQVELRNALRADPRSAAAHIAMAQLQMKLADPGSAEREFRAAAAAGADRWALIGPLGEAMLAQGENRQALAQLPPKGPTPELTVKNLLLRSIAQLALNDLPAAEATLADARQVAPDSAETALMAARVAAAKGDLPTTEANVDKALKADPNQVEALIMKERLLTSKGDRKGALPYADRAIQSSPWSAMARINRANLEISFDQDEKAQADVNAVLDVQPRFLDAVFLNAVLMARRGKFVEASVQLEKLEGSAARLPAVLYYSALVSAQLGRTEAAAEYARRYNALVPADPDGSRVVAQTELAAQRPAAALAVLERSVASGQTDPATEDLLGRTYALLGNAPAARQAFAKALAAVPDNPVFNTHLGLAELQSGDAEAAVKSFTRSFQEDPKQPTAGEGLVAATLTTGNVAQAEAALAKLRASTGETEAVAILSGLLKLRQDDLEGARTVLADAVKRFPDSTFAKLNLARVLARQGRAPAAVALLNEVLAKQPTNAAALGVLLPLLSAANQLPPAIQALEAAHKAAPKNLAFTAMLADGYTAVDAPQRAIDLVRDAPDQAKLPPILLAPLARAQAASNNIPGAISSYRDALEQAPKDLTTRNGQVDLLLKQKDFAAAKESLQQGLAATPGDFRIMVSLVNLENSTAGAAAALKLADQIAANPANMPDAAAIKGDLLRRLQRLPDSAQAYKEQYERARSGLVAVRYASVLSAIGKDGEADAMLRDWLSTNPNTPDAEEALAQSDIRAGRLAEARDRLEHLLGQRPLDPLALNNLAWVYQALKDPRARATAQRAFLQAPGADTADTLGWIMVQDGAAKAAVPILQDALDRKPADPAIRYHLAVALRDDGRGGDAASLLKPIVDSPDTFGEKPEATKLLADLTR